MNNKSYYILTFGCQMNERDSENIAGMLENMGYNETNKKDDADVIVINTCCIRENAENKVYGNLGVINHLKKMNPDLILAVCGCMMQQEHVVATIQKKYPFVDIVFGTHNLHKFPEMLVKAHSLNKINIDVWDKEGEIIEGLPSKRKHDFKAFVNITYGCNNFCTYCIVPYTRGRERSRKPEDIIKEVKDLAINGTKEITLLGQNVNSYGKTLDIEIDFPDLLYKLNEIDGIERIRFMTSHPKDLSEKLILAMKECNKVCNHIHLPVQSGSTRVLHRMNRKYTKEHYLEIVRKLKEAIPDIAITTDFIIGFPGETEEDFEHTLDLVKKVEYDAAFTFLYSIRKGTPALKYEDQVPDDIKHHRFNRLVDTLNEISLRKNQILFDQVFDVLVEGESANDPSKLTGRTTTNKLVNFEGNKKYINKIIPVKITDCKTFSLKGVAQI